MIVTHQDFATSFCSDRAPGSLASYNPNIHKFVSMIEDEASRLVVMPWELVNHRSSCIPVLRSQLTVPFRVDRVAEIELVVLRKDSYISNCIVSILWHTCEVARARHK